MLHTFDPDDEISKSTFVCDNIVKPLQLSLATVGKDQKPRNVCVNLDVDKDFNFFRKSRTTSLHSQHISYNPYVGVLIFGVYGQYDFALYASGKVRAVEDINELKRLLDIKYKQKGRPEKLPGELLGDIPKRIYLCELEEVYICDLDHKKTKVDISMLKKERGKRTPSDHL